MIDANNMKKTGLRRLIAVISCSGLLVAFQNCGNGNFSTVPVDNPTGGLESQPPPNSDRRSDIVDIQIPDQRYEKLSESPFFKLADKIAVNTLNYANLKLYAPQFPLYSDGAAKRRWIYIPEGASIDNSNPDEWIFPQGTILYKEFSVGGKKIETRVFEKVSNLTGSAAWRSSVYVWLVNQMDADLLKVDNFYSQTEAEMLPYQANTVASQYRMVNMSQCITCHGSARDVSQGFSFLQLSDSNRTVNVKTLGDIGYFSNPFTRFDVIPGTNSEKAAIGYLQSNCATCHGGKGPGPHNFKHLSTSQSLADEPLIKSIQASAGLVTYGSPTDSRLFVRMNNGTMPKITLFVKDSIGIQVLSDWITSSVMP